MKTKLTYQCICLFLISIYSYTAFSQSNPINQIDSTGYSLLSKAVQKKNKKLVISLLSKGADPNLKNKNQLQTTPLMEASNFNLIEISKVLIANGADVNIRDKNNDPVIHWSAYYGQVELTQLFLDNGANSNLKSIHSDGVMHVALKEWRENIVDLLLENGVYIHKVTLKDKPTISAVKSGSLEKLKAINSGFNVNAIDGSGTSVLIKAASKGYFNIVKYLIEKGADINTMNPTGHTALNRAIYFKHTKIAQFLIDNSADINKTDNRFKLSPIIAAVKSKNIELGKILLEKGVEINILDGANGMTPIMWAVAFQQKGFVKLLLKYNPDLSIKSPIYGVTVFKLTKDKDLLKNNLKQ